MCALTAEQSRNRQRQRKIGGERHGQADGLRRKLYPGNGAGLGNERASVMKIYEGKHHRRFGRHCRRRRLSEHYDVKRFTKFGFEWTYEGDSPRQLALAILWIVCG